MPLSTIENAKELAVGYQPLVLATLTLRSGTVLRFASHPLNAAEGGVPYGGHNYLGRIERWSFGAIRANTEGVDLTPRVSMTLSDADLSMWNYERTEGIKGATLAAVFLFREPGTANYSSNSLRVFTGICDQPSSNGQHLVVTANSIFNFQKKMLPDFPIQKRCPLLHPNNAAQKALAAIEGSIFYHCGDTNPANTSCNFTKANCVSNGMYALGRFAGITFVPPTGGQHREYVSGNTVEIKNNMNESRYGDYVPVVYGRNRVNPPIMPVIGDGNLTRFETLLCSGAIDRGLESTRRMKVIVNGLLLEPAGYYDAGGVYRAFANVRNELRWNWVSDGSRNGTPNADAPYNGQSDPYGSIAAIMCVLPKSAASSESIPSTTVIFDSPKIRVFYLSDPGGGTAYGGLWYRREFSTNPIWILLDIWIRGGLALDRFNLPRLISAAAICDATVTYTDQHGATASRKRYECSLPIRGRRSVQEILTRVRETCGAIAGINEDGLVDVFLEGTLAEQQPAPVTGSNYNTPIASKLRNGSFANGYAAYRFDETNLTREPEFQAEPLNAQPNKLIVNFQDAANDFTRSAYTVVDTDAVHTAQQDVSEELKADGIMGSDQAVRLARRKFARIHRGNPTGSTLGTMRASIETSFKGVFLKPGHIVLLNLPYRGIINQPFRILEVEPEHNFRTMRLLVEWHNDDWFLDSYGAEPEERYSNPNRDRLERASLPWFPDHVSPQAGDPIHPPFFKSFGVTPRYEISADPQPIITVDIEGSLPVNEFADCFPPIVSANPTILTSGGSIIGSYRSYYYAVCAKRSGQYSAPSNIEMAAIASTGSTHRIQFSVTGWDANADGYAVFAGESPNALCHQFEGAGKPSTLTLDVIKAATWGLPDQETDRTVVEPKIVEHSGVFGVAVSSVGTRTITVAAAGWTTNEWAGYDLSFLYRGYGVPVGLLNFRVISNTATTLTLDAAGPDPLALGIQVGDVFVMRSRPSISGNTISDPKWENSLSNNGFGLAPGYEVGNLLWFYEGPAKGEIYTIASNTSTSITIAGNWITTPTSASRYIVVRPDHLGVDVASVPFSNSDPSAKVTLRVPLSNFKDRTIVFAIRTMDGSENKSPNFYAQIREVYLPGRPPAERTVTANTTVNAEDETIYVDTTSGNVTVTMIPQAQRKGKSLFISHIAGANTCTVAASPGESINGIASVTIDPGASLIFKTEG